MTALWLLGVVRIRGPKKKVKGHRELRNSVMCVSELFWRLVCKKLKDHTDVFACLTTVLSSYGDATVSRKLLSKLVLVRSSAFRKIQHVRVWESTASKHLYVELLSSRFDFLTPQVVFLKLSYAPGWYINVSLWFCLPSRNFKSEQLGQEVSVLQQRQAVSHQHRGEPGSGEAAVPEAEVWRLGEPDHRQDDHP